MESEPLSRNAETSPILNYAHDMPKFHWRMDERFRVVAGSAAVAGRRPSGAEQSVPTARMSTAQREHQRATGHGAAGREQGAPFRHINALRGSVGRWGDEGYPGVPAKVRALLQYWSDAENERRPYFCQREAVETAMWLRHRGAHTEEPEARRAVKALAEANRNLNEARSGTVIERQCLKMATGTGKTWVMAMLILCDAAEERDEADTLILVPNVTIRTRLQCLSTERDAGISLSEHERDIYEVLTPRRLAKGLKARIRVSVRTWHAFRRRLGRTGVEKADEAPGKRERRVLGEMTGPAVDETTEAMLDRVLPQHVGRKVRVLNDEGHHCYRKDDREAPEGRWFEVLETLARKGRLQGAVVDLSATPMWIKGAPEAAGEPKPEIFPWTVSDTPLIEAIEAGLCKIPQLPVDDDTDRSEPVYRETYKALGRTRLARSGEALPGKLVALLKTMCADQQQGGFVDALGRQGQAPVTIMVVSDMADAEVLYAHIAGREVDGEWVPGLCDEWSNVDRATKAPREDIRTWIVHSKLDEIGIAEETDASTLQSSDVKRLLKTQEQFVPKREDESAKAYASRIMRVRDTVGVRGAAGEHVRCIVAVEMLNEGWDASTVTHIVGYRAFESQLLCEQIAGRSLRRVQRPEPGVRPATEVARVTGVPFSFMGGVQEAPAPATRWAVHRVEGREEMRIRLPQVEGYRIRVPQTRLMVTEEALKAPYDWRMQTDPTRMTAEGTIGPQWETEFGADRRRKTGIYAIAADVVRGMEESRDDAQRRWNGRRRRFIDVVTAIEAWLDEHRDGEKPVTGAKLASAEHRQAIARIIAQSLEGPDEEPVQITPRWADDAQWWVDTSETDEIQTALRAELRYPMEMERTTVRSELDASANHTGLEQQIAMVLDTTEYVEAWVRTRTTASTGRCRTSTERKASSGDTSRISPPGCARR